MRTKKTSLLKIHRASVPVLFLCAVLILASCSDNFKKAFSKESGIHPPLPGNSGIISVSYTSPTLIDIRWQPAADDSTKNNHLQYRVFAAKTEFVSIDEAVASADELTVGWTSGITSLQKPVIAGRSYQWCNVFVCDETGNTAAYAGAVPHPYANTHPLPGNNGMISSYTDPDRNTLITWTKGNDSETPPTSLQYRVFYGNTESSIDSFEHASALAVEITGGWQDDISSLQAALPPAASYWCNVFIMDDMGLVSSYAGRQIIIDAAVPGAGGSLVLSRSGAAVRITWTQASSTGGERYRVYYSGYDNISSYALAEAAHNGTEITNGWTAGITQADIGTLAKNSTWHFNVFTCSAGGIVSAYTSSSITIPPDSTPVLPVNPAVVYELNPAFTASLLWSKSSDDYTQTENLHYRVFCGTVNAGSSFSSYVNGSGFPLQPEITLGWTTDIASAVTPVLNRSTVYYCTVFVRDAAGQISAYPVTAVTVPSSTLTPGSGGILTVIGSNSGINLSWTAASDSFTAQDRLVYRVFRSAAALTLPADSIPVSAAATEVTPGWTENITSISAPSAGASVVYYIVYVRNLDGTVRSYAEYAYSAASPQAGGSGILNAEPKAAKKVDLTWTAASDGQTAQSSLEYCIYSSEVVTGAYDAYTTVLSYAYAVAGAGGLSPIAKLELNWTPDITAYQVQMDKNTVYYFNVFVRDADGNISPYIPVSALTGN